ncbi:MAG TPA: hypothetical protein VF202_01195 [Trueperaceae bacterium]
MQPAAHGRLLTSVGEAVAATEPRVPTPNRFTGTQDIHGPLDRISVQDMRRASEMHASLAEPWGRS